MIKLLEKHHPRQGPTWEILVQHSRLVANKAVDIAQKLSAKQCIDINFVEEAALLHDIGIHLTDAPDIGCSGKHPYLAHGILGRQILEQEDLHRHAMVCERHIGVGLSRTDIIEQGLPLPHREMQPISIEEIVITYADLFFSKSKHSDGKERPIELVRERMMRHGEDKVARLDQWHKLFSE